MDIKKTVLVTALFDIGRDKWKNFTMSYHTYQHWMRNILYLDTNLIIYTEEKFRKSILDFRREVDPNLEKTIMVIQPLDQIDGYKIFNDKLVQLMESGSFKKKIQFDVPEMTQPLYNVVMFSKLYYILDAYQKNLFDADLYVWADAGVIRNDNPIKNKKWPSIQKINQLDNNKVTFFCHHDRVNIIPAIFESHALSQSRFIQGGSIFVPKKCVIDLAEWFKTEALTAIENGYVGSDEKIFDFVYIKHPDKFNIIKCNWREYIDLFMDPLNMEVVIARYNEDVSWTDKIKYPVKIYNKNQNDFDKFENNLPNVGREAHTFFSYIVNNYDKLPDYVTFLQGNPFDHCRDAVEKINNFDFKTEFLPLGTVHKQTMEYESINAQVETYSKIIGFKMMFPTYMVPGAQHIVSKRTIRKNKKEFYEKILSTISNEDAPFDIYNIEKTLFQIYGIYNV